MMLMRMMSSPCKGTFSYMTRRCYDPMCPIAYDKILLRFQNRNQKNNSLQVQTNRFFHTTRVIKDMEAAFKCVAGGIAATGVIGPGIGIGVIFGNLVNAAARNPSVSNKLFQFGIMGAAFCESLALFALMISFITIMT